MNVLYINSYTSVKYVRNVTLLQSLTDIPEVNLCEIRSEGNFIFRTFKTVFFTYKALLQNKFDVVFFGFRAHEYYWFIRPFLKCACIFDEFVSPYDSIYKEKKISSYFLNFLQPVLFMIEQSILDSSDIVLFDTHAQQEYYSDLFQIKLAKTAVIYLGTDEGIFSNHRHSKKNASHIFTVFYYGSMLPLHGIEYILEAAKLLKNELVLFEIIGGKGSVSKNIKKYIENHHLNSVVYSEWVEYEQLPGRIKNADLCLGGPFGGTEQAKRVITGKTYQFLAMEKPVVIGQGAESKIFESYKNCLTVKQKSAAELEKMIRFALNHQNDLSFMAQSGHQHYQKHFGRKKRKQAMELVLAKISTK